MCVCVCACLCWVNGRERECSYIISLNFWLSWTPLSHPIITFGSTSPPPKKSSLFITLVSLHFDPFSCAFYVFYCIFSIFFLQKSWILWVKSHFGPPPPITQLSITMPPPTAPYRWVIYLNAPEAVLNYITCRHDQYSICLNTLWSRANITNRNFDLWINNFKFYHLSMILVSK